MNYYIENNNKKYLTGTYSRVLRNFTQNNSITNIDLFGKITLMIHHFARARSLSFVNLPVSFVGFNKIFIRQFSTSSPRRFHDDDFGYLFNEPSLPEKNWVPGTLFFHDCFLYEDEKLLNKSEQGRLRKAKLIEISHGKWNEIISSTYNIDPNEKYVEGNIYKRELNSEIEKLNKQLLEKSQTLVHIDSNDIYQKYLDKIDWNNLNMLEDDPDYDRFIYLKEQMVVYEKDIKDFVDRLEYLHEHRNNVDKIKNYFKNHYPNKELTIFVLFLVTSGLVVVLAVAGLSLHNVNLNDPLTAMMLWTPTNLLLRSDQNKASLIIHTLEFNIKQAIFIKLPILNDLGDFQKKEKYNKLGHKLDKNLEKISNELYNKPLNLIVYNPKQFSIIKYQSKTIIYPKFKITRVLCELQVIKKINFKTRNILVKIYGFNLKYSFNNILNSLKIYLITYLKKKIKNYMIKNSVLYIVETYKHYILVIKNDILIYFTKIIEYINQKFIIKWYLWEFYTFLTPIFNCGIMFSICSFFSLFIFNVNKLTKPNRQLAVNIFTLYTCPKCYSNYSDQDYINFGQAGYNADRIDEFDLHDKDKALEIKSFKFEKLEQLNKTEAILSKIKFYNNSDESLKIKDYILSKPVSLDNSPNSKDLSNLFRDLRKNLMKLDDTFDKKITEALNHNASTAKEKGDKDLVIISLKSFRETMWKEYYQKCLKVTNKRDQLLENNDSLIDPVLLNDPSNFSLTENNSEPDQGVTQNTSSSGGQQTIYPDGTNKGKSSAEITVITQRDRLSERNRLNRELSIIKEAERILSEKYKK